MAGLLVAGGVALSAVSAQAAGEMVACYGINACKGMGDCGGKGHSCAGMNACKGQGYVSVPKDACTKIQGGSLTAKE